MVHIMPFTVLINTMCATQTSPLSVVLQHQYTVLTVHSLSIRVTPQTWFIYLLISMAQPIYFRVTWKPESLTILFLAKMYFSLDLIYLCLSPFLSGLHHFLYTLFLTGFCLKVPTSHHLLPTSQSAWVSTTSWIASSHTFTYLGRQTESFHTFFFFFLKQHARYWILF